MINQIVSIFLFALAIGKETLNPKRNYISYFPASSAPAFWSPSSADNSGAALSLLSYLDQFTPPPPLLQHTTSSDNQTVEELQTGEKTEEIYYIFMQHFQCPQHLQCGTPTLQITMQLNSLPCPIWNSSPIHHPLP